VKNRAAAGRATDAARASAPALEPAFEIRRRGLYNLHGMRRATHNSALVTVLFLSLALALAQVCTLGCEFLGCAPAEAASLTERAGAHCHQSKPEQSKPEQSKPEPRPEEPPDCGKHLFAGAFEPPSHSSAQLTETRAATPTAEPASPFSLDLRRQASLAVRGAPLRSPPRRETHAILRI
jgi:hypothetical protein